MVMDLFVKTLMNVLRVMMQFVTEKLRVKIPSDLFRVSVKMVCMATAHFARTSTSVHSTQHVMLMQHAAISMGLSNVLVLMVSLGTVQYALMWTSVTPTLILVTKKLLPVSIHLVDILVCVIMVTKEMVAIVMMSTNAVREHTHVTTIPNVITL